MNRQWFYIVLLCFLVKNIFAMENITSNKRIKLDIHVKELTLDEYAIAKQTPLLEWFEKNIKVESFQTLPDKKKFTLITAVRDSNANCTLGVPPPSLENELATLVQKLNVSINQLPFFVPLKTFLTFSPTKGTILTYYSTDNIEMNIKNNGLSLTDVINPVNIQNKDVVVLSPPLLAFSYGVFKLLSEHGLITKEQASGWQFDGTNLLQVHNKAGIKKIIIGRGSYDFISKLYPQYDKEKLSLSFTVRLKELFGLADDSDVIVVDQLCSAISKCIQDGRNGKLLLNSYEKSKQLLAYIKDEKILFFEGEDNIFKSYIKTSEKLLDGEYKKNYSDVFDILLKNEFDIIEVPAELATGLYSPSYTGFNFIDGLYLSSSEKVYYIALGAPGVIGRVFMDVFALTLEKLGIGIYFLGDDYINGHPQKTYKAANKLIARLDGSFGLNTLTCVTK